MKYTREGSKIILEVEPLDCHRGDSPEMMADAILAGMLVGKKYFDQIIIPVLQLSQEVSGKLEEAVADLKERWEILE